MLERTVKIRPAYDKRDKDPNKNYGICAAHMFFYVKGEKGVVQFSLLTNWNLPHVQKELDRKTDLPRLLSRPMPADLGYHSPTPMYEGQTQMPCDLLPEGKCYYDGSGLRAYDVFKQLLEKGDEGVWEMLESEYRCLFENGGHAHECLCAHGNAYLENGP